MKPRVSVIMSVYNGARDAPAAIDSILAQTFTDFEFIIIDNGSYKDNSLHVLQQHAARDSRIKLHYLPQNIGLAGALNYGIEQAQGEYIARQDHDDISKPERLAAQVAYMDTHPHCGLLGTRAEVWRGKHHRTNLDHATSNEELQFDILSNNPFVHSSVMIRTSALNTVGAYTTDSERQPPEDYELWSRLARCYEVANLPERYLIYHEIQSSMSRDTKNPFTEKVIRITRENLAHATDKDLNDSLCNDTARLIHAQLHSFAHGNDLQACSSLLNEVANGLSLRFPAYDYTVRALAMDEHIHRCYALSQRPIQTGLLMRLKSAAPEPFKTFARRMIGRI